MRVLSKYESQEIDKMAPVNFHIPLGYMMENAGAGVGRAIVEDLTQCGIPNDDKSVLFVCGVGNNGADGVVAARHVFEQNIPVKIFISGQLDNGSKLFTEQLRIAKSIGIFIITTLDDIQWHRVACIVEGLVGMGGTGDLREPIQILLHHIEEQSKTFHIPLWAIDVPAGLQVNTGLVSPGTLHYDHTITFGAPKIGHYLYPGKTYTGTLHVMPLGIPWEKNLSVFAADKTNEHHGETYLLDTALCKRVIKPRIIQAHKGTNGSTLIIGGSPGMIGAPILAVEGAVHSGAGKSSVAVPLQCLPIVQGKAMPEVMTGAFDTLDQLLCLTDGKDAVAIGPGIGRSEATCALVNEYITHYEGPLVIDADALYALGELKENDFPIKDKVSYIMTPHLGEFSRLTGQSISYIQEHYIELARAFARTYSIVLVLKGIPSLVALPNGTVYINSRGNAGMGTGGMGDVLTGVIAAFISQGYSLEESALLGTYVHSKSADNLYESEAFGYTPSDVSAGIGRVITELLN